MCCGDRVSLCSLVWPQTHCGASPSCPLTSSCALSTRYWDRRCAPPDLVPKWNNSQCSWLPAYLVILLQILWKVKMKWILTSPFQFYFSWMGIVPACISLHHICAWFLQKSEEGIWSSGTGVAQLWAAMWQLGMEAGSSARASSVLFTRHRAISPAPRIHLRCNICHSGMQCLRGDKHRTFWKPVMSD